MFIRFIRDYYLNASRMFRAGETVDVAADYAQRFISEGAAIDSKSGMAWGAQQITLMQTALPVILPSSGSVGDNGALTLTTALLVAYPEAYMFFPAGALFSGSVAGFYYVRMSTVTAGVVYQNQYFSGAPESLLAGSPTPIVATGPGAYVQSTATITSITTTIPAGLLGPGGVVEQQAYGMWNNSATAKTVRHRFGGNTLYTQSSTTSVGGRFWTSVNNAGVPNTQYIFSNGVSLAAGPGSGVTGASPVLLTNDTSVNQPASFQLQLAVDTDWVGLQWASVRVFPFNKG